MGIGGRLGKRYELSLDQEQTAMDSTTKELSVLRYVSVTSSIARRALTQAARRLTQRMQRTAQSVMRFACANRPPLCSAADARR
jgi:hypothetical protein